MSLTYELCNGDRNQEGRNGVVASFYIPNKELAVFQGPSMDCRQAL
jgi:hypothetical protein